MKTRVRSHCFRFIRLVPGLVLLAGIGPGPDAAADGGGTAYLDALDLSHVRQGWGEASARRTIIDQPLTLAGRVYERGLGTHASGVAHVDLDGETTRFRAWVGVDDETEGRGSIRFSIYGDGRSLFDSGVRRGGDAPVQVDVALSGIRHLVLVSGSAGDGQDFDHADWADARFDYTGRPPALVNAPPEEKVLLTPPPPASPRIQGPRVVGARPGSPVLFRIPCTGERPIRFTAQGMPDGLSLDPGTGIIEGVIRDREPRDWTVALRAENRHGDVARELRFVVGDTLALTPPMGWNSWYIHYHRVTQAHMEEAAHAMVESGMADYGYQYVNIDDCWMKKRGEEPYRNPEGSILGNATFPDIQGMVEAIHARGLKAGLYTSPGPWTCAGYVGAHGYEAEDAAQFAAWGFDFLKYDWCSYGQVASGEGRERLQRPYRLMAELLRQQPRDIVLNLCQYGMGEVWEWGGEVGGHCWRTTGDLGLNQGGLLPGFYAIGLANARWHEYAKPGQWNDPDYLLLGWVGDARGMGEGRPTTLTGNEQYSYMSMWSLMAAPLIFSGDMAKLDPFTLNVLCNHEVIDVNQDVLGRQARIIRRTEEDLILAKPLADGSLAVGLFNLAEFDLDIPVGFEALGLEGPRRIRDLWRQLDEGLAADSFQAAVPRHGVKLVRLIPGRATNEDRRPSTSVGSEQNPPRPRSGE